MPDTWTTVAAAAAALDVHPRTIERRIASGKIQTRRSDAGQVEVMVDLPEPAATTPDPFAVVADQATAQVQLATAASSLLVQQSRADAERAYGELELARREAVRSRRGALMAWSAVACMAIATCVAIGWTSHTLTATADNVRQLKDQAQRAENEADRAETQKTRLGAERDALRTELVSAKVAEANAEGRAAALTAMSAIANTSRPTTKPANLIQRLAIAFGNE